MAASVADDTTAAAPAPAVERPPAFQNYAGMVMAAPMVRVSSLAFRIMCARCGSDVVFTEEIVAAKLARCVRETRPLPEFLLAQPGEDPAGSGWDVPALSDARFPRGTVLVEYVRYEPHKHTAKRAPAFTTIKLPAEYRDARPWAEGKPLILQMGVADPATGAKAAALVKDDVDGFDVNMGCPKKFSVSNGMGASLMEEPERAASILSAIRGAIGPTKPFSFKTRVFEDVDKSVAQLSKCLATGAVHSVTLHARLRPQRSETKPKTELAAEVVRRMRPLFPHIAYVFNGSLGCSGLDGAGDIGPSEGAPWGGRAAMLSAVKELGFDGGLVARDAMWNPTVLLPEGGGYTADYVAVHRRLFELHAHYGTYLTHVKYHLTRTFGQGPLQAAHKAMYRAILDAKTFTDFATALGVSADDIPVWEGRHALMVADVEGSPDVGEGGAAPAKRERAATTEAASPTGLTEQQKPPQPEAEKPSAVAAAS